MKKHAVVGYIVMCAPKKKGGAQYFEPLAYGENGEPGPDELLKGRGASLFLTRENATDALKDTLTIATTAGYKWPKKHEFMICEISSAEKTQMAKHGEGSSS